MSVLSNMLSRLAIAFLILGFFIVILHFCHEEGASQEGRGHKPQARTLWLLGQGAVGRAEAWSEWRSRQLAQAQSGPET